MEKDKALTAALTAKEAELVRLLIAKKIKGIDWVLLEKGPDMDKSKKAGLEERLKDLKRLYQKLYASNSEEKAAEKPVIRRRSPQT